MQLSVFGILIPVEKVPPDPPHARLTMAVALAWGVLVVMGTGRYLLR